MTDFISGMRHAAQIVAAFGDADDPGAFRGESATTSTFLADRLREIATEMESQDDCVSETDFVKIGIRELADLRAKAAMKTKSGKSIFIVTAFRQNNSTGMCGYVTRAVTASNKYEAIGKSIFIFSKEGEKDDVFLKPEALSFEGIYEKLKDE